VNVDGGSGPIDDYFAMAMWRWAELQILLKNYSTLANFQKHAKTIENIFPFAFLCVPFASLRLCGENFHIFNQLEQT